MQKKIDLWVGSIQKLSCATLRFPQEGLCAFTKSLQMEWTFLQRVIPCYSSFFQPLEDAITSHFLPALFHTEIVPPRELTRLPRKNAGLGIPDPTEQKDQSFSTSSKASRLLMKSLVNHSAPFCLKDHNDHVKEVRSSHQAHKAEIAKLSLDFFLANNPSCKRITEAASQSGLWISIPPTLDTKTTLSPTECRDNLFLRYNMTPPNLNSRCDGCHQPFSVNHGLNCPKGGLIIHRHDELRNELGDLLMNAFGRTAVRTEPHSNPVALTDPTVAGNQEPNRPSAGATFSETNANRGDLLVRNLEENSTDAIIDFQVTNIFSNSYFHKELKDHLTDLQSIKDKKHKRNCERQRRKFIPFIASCNGNLGPLAERLLKRIAAKLAHKWSQPYSYTIQFVRNRVSISLARSASHCLRGSRVPTSFFSHNRYDFDEAEGIYSLGIVW